MDHVQDVFFGAYRITSLYFQILLYLMMCLSGNKGLENVCKEHHIMVEMHVTNQDQHCTEFQLFFSPDGFRCLLVLI